MTIKAVHMPKFPECWQTCGSCASGTIFILELHVGVGDEVNADDPILTLETGKIALDIPSPYTGRVVSLHVIEGDQVGEGALLAMIEVAA